MRIIFLGPPGSGKGTQARLLHEKYKIPIISAGNILRCIVKSNTTISNKIKSIIESGKLVPNDLIAYLIKRKIHSIDCSNGFLLDGFPRTITQAKFVKNFNIGVDIVIEFRVSDQVVIDRIIHRRVHEPSGRVYHTKFYPPKNENRDDITGEELTIRMDDKESIVYERLAEYNHQINLLLDFYRKEEKHGDIKLFSVDSSYRVGKIHSEIIRILKNFIPSYKV